MRVTPVMNITGLKPYVKGQPRKKRNDPTPKQRARWSRISELGCLICGFLPEIHHLYTGGGGRKDHDKVAPLCFYHHRGSEGFHSTGLGRKAWQEKYMTEEQMELEVFNRLDMLV